MALSSGALTTVQRALAYLRLDPADARFHAPAIDLYWDTDAGADTTATVEVEADTLNLVTSAGTGDESTDLTASAFDTITELVARINAITGWEAVALTYGDALSVDLVDIAAVSAYGVANRQTLNIVDHSHLERIIEGVTDEIETYLGRHIVSADYVQEYHFQRSASQWELVLREPEVTAVERLQLDQASAFTAEYTGSDTYARIEVTDTEVKTLSGTTGTPTENNLTFAANTTVAAIVAAVPADWTFTTVTDGPSAYLVREGVRDAKSRSVDLHAWVDYDGDYTVDYPAGVVTFDHTVWPYSLRFRVGSPRILVGYTAGYSTVPDDVDLVALEMIASEWSSMGRDREVQSESLGDYSYTATALIGESASATRWKSRLDRYRRMLP